MARDIRQLFEDDKTLHEKMPKNHQDRFLEKLDKTFPEKRKSSFNWMQIAASLVVLFGLSFGALKFYESEKPVKIADNNTIETKTLGDVSPGLKEVEDYYLASINLELSKMEYTPETKDLFDGYLEQLNELDEEYKRLSIELTNSGPSELTLNALIDNLKFRLNLIYRLRSKLKELNTSDDSLEEENKTI